MHPADSPPASAFVRELVVPDSAIDANGHVNNVVFLQWMQEVAIQHFQSVVDSVQWSSLGLTWVARSHHIEYLAPAFANERLQIITWVADFSRVRSLRLYLFRRGEAGQLLVRGETDWVLINAKSGKPASIPEMVKQAFNKS